VWRLATQQAWPWPETELAKSSTELWIQLMVTEWDLVGTAEELERNSPKQTKWLWRSAAQ
jgi:hypothetical protein